MKDYMPLGPKFKDFGHEGIFKIPHEVLENQSRKSSSGDYCSICQKMTMKIKDIKGVGRRWACSHCGNKELIRSNKVY
jgi:hypothetical protein